jgi:hypothetical protein
MKEIRKMDRRDASVRKAIDQMPLEHAPREVIVQDGHWVFTFAVVKRHPR